MTPSAKERLERYYHKSRLKMGLALHRFVLDEEEETARMRRRFHIHVCLLGASGLFTYFSVAGYLSLTLVTVVSPGFMVIQEYIDRIGRF
jgi:hypothetical protein